MPRSFKRYLTKYIEGVVRREVTKHIDRNVTRLDFARSLIAGIERANYVDRHMNGSTPCSDKWSVLDLALQHAGPGGLYLEFGVWRGDSLNHIAQRVPQQTVHGFDSFQGIPEDWRGDVKQGTFDTHGELPRVEPNVDLHVGWFDEVLPEFVERQSGDVSFLHIDCDLYSSTRTVFSMLGDRIGSGCVIVFDEYSGYPGWQDHEHKAFQEFVRQSHLSYHYLCHNENQWQVAVLMK